MSATDELRRMLDERGVERWEGDDGEPAWTDGDGRMYYARQEFTFRGLTDKVSVYHLTPEQAIEVALGRGTCVNDTPEPYYFACSSCGTCLNWNPNFCPYCGAEVMYA